MEFLAIVIAIILMVLAWRIFLPILVVIGFFIFALLQGCGSTDPLAREWNDQATIENYTLCMSVYEQFSMPTIHRGHSHTNPNRIRIHDLRQDLADNNCRRMLGSLWVDNI